MITEPIPHSLLAKCVPPQEVSNEQAAQWLVQALGRFGKSGNPDSRHQRWVITADLGFVMIAYNTEHFALLVSDRSCALLFDAKVAITDGSKAQVYRVNKYSPGAWLTLIQVVIDA